MTGLDVSLRVVRCVYYRNDHRWDYPANLYPYNSLYVVLGGDGRVRVGDTETVLQPGHAYLIPPDTPFACRCEKWVEKVYVEFHAEVVPGLDVFDGLSRVTGAALCDRELPGLAALRESGMPAVLPVSRELPQDTLPARLALEGFLLQVIAQLVPGDWQAPGDRVLRFKPILDEINAGLSASLRIGEIAHRHGWHPSALSRAFAGTFGCGIKQYIENLLADRLRQELLTGSKTNRELAVQYGFSDAYYLSAFFKRREGVSPSEYRRRNTR